MQISRPVLLGALLATILAAGCGAKDERVGPFQYGISYTVGADAYDEDASQPAFDACAGLPGAAAAGVDTSLPPGLSVRFEGTDAEQQDLESCLRALPDTRLSGPREVPDGF